MAKRATGKIVVKFLDKNRVLRFVRSVPVELATQFRFVHDGVQYEQVAVNENGIKSYAEVV